MKVTVKPKFNASKQNIEKFGDNRYLIYLPFEEDHEAVDMLKVVLSKYLGTPGPRIMFVRVDELKDWIFEVR